MTGVSFGILGPVAAWRDGSEIELGPPQQRTCLAVLLLHRNEEVTTDRLVDALWPSNRPRNALQIVRTYVYRLRGRLGAPADEGHGTLLTHTHGYEFRAEPERFDADRFESFVRAGRSAVEAGDGARAESLLVAALELVRGPAVPELPDDDFARYERTRLDELQLVAREELIEARLAQGRHRELIAELRAAAAAEPLRERAWGQLMVALYRSGRQAEALAAYREARRVLDDELGLEPGPALRALERLILLQDGALLHSPGLRSRMPTYATSFVGRESELGEMLEALHSERLVTLVGPVGAGKTRLAAEVASRLRPALGPRLWWVDLGPVAPGRAVAAVAAALEAPELPGRAPADLVIALLGDDPGLLVLDNCEHVLDELAGLAARILAEAPRTRILCTGREALRIGGELVRPVAALPVPREPPSDAAELVEWPAARLFGERAAAARPGFRLDSQEPATIAEILAHADGLPLALELAAAQLRSLSMAELAQGLRQRRLALDTGDRSGPPRQRSLDEAIGWSYELLAPKERALLRQISVFPRSFDLAAAEAVTPGDELSMSIGDGLARLASASLLVAETEREATRFRLLQTVRSFALEAASPEEKTEAARGHRDHFASLAEDVYLNMVGPGLPAWLPRAREEYENLEAALQWSLDQGDAEPALRLGAALARYAFRTGLVTEGRRLLGSALEAASPGGLWWARALGEEARLVHAAGDPALDKTHEAIAACGREDDAESLAFALSLLAEQRAQTGGDEEARAALDHAQALFEASGSEEGLALVDELLGRLSFAQGDVERAATLLRRARDRMRRIRGQLDAGWILVELAQVLLARGRPDEALTPASEAVSDFRRRGDPRGLAASFVSLGRAHALTGDSERGQALVGEALVLSKRWGYAAQAAEAETALAELSTV